MYIVIVGGGKVGAYLAGVMLSNGHEVAVIDQNKYVADALSVELEGEYLIINGDGCDSRFQEDAGIRHADIFVGATGQDDTNLVACEIAQRVFRVPRVIGRVNNPKNLRVFRAVGIECVSSTTLIAGLIEEEALLGSVSVVSSLTHGNVSFLEFSVPHMRHHSDEEGVCIGDIVLPAGAMIIAVAYEDDAEVASDDIILYPGDQIVVISDTEVVDEVRAIIRGL